MKLICEGLDLSDAVLKVIKATATRTTNPILEGIKLRAGEDCLTPSATDLEISIEKSIPADVKIEGEVEPYPYSVRVPVEMIAFQNSTAPIVFLLHVVNGVIDELEIITADSTQIDADSIQLEKVEYEVNHNCKLE